MRTHGTRVEGALQVSRAPERRHDEHTHIRETGTNRLRGRDAVHAGHLDVDDGNVDGGACAGRRVRRCQARQLLEGLRAIGGLRDNLDVALQVQQPRQGTANHRLVVGHKYPNRHVTLLSALGVLG